MCIPPPHPHPPSPTRTHTTPAHSYALPLAEQHEGLRRLLGPGPVAPGPWYDASVTFSHGGHIARCVFPLGGSQRSTDVVVRVRGAGGVAWGDRALGSAARLCSGRDHCTLLAARGTCALTLSTPLPQAVRRQSPLPSLLYNAVGSGEWRVLTLDASVGGGGAGGMGGGKYMSLLPESAQPAAEGAAAPGAVAAAAAAHKAHKGQPAGKKE